MSDANVHARPNFPSHVIAEAFTLQLPEVPALLSPCNSIFNTFFWNFPSVYCQPTCQMANTIRNKISSPRPTFCSLIPNITLRCKYLEKLISSNNYNISSTWMVPLFACQSSTFVLLVLSQNKFSPESHMRRVTATAYRIQ